MTIKLAVPITLAMTVLAGCNLDLQQEDPREKIRKPQKLGLSVRAAELIATSPRVADIAAYMLKSTGKSKFTQAELNSLEIIQKEVEYDAVTDVAYANLAIRGFNNEISAVDGGYLVRNSWMLNVESGSPFETTFPSGARMMLHGEFLPFPQCEADYSPILIHGELYPASWSPVGVTINEEQRGWRLFIGKTPHPYQHRILVDAGCAKKPTPDEQPSEG